MCKKARHATGQFRVRVKEKAMNGEKPVSAEMINELYDILLRLKDREECNALFQDLCTYGEVEKMAQRVRAARLLMEGKTYNQVMDETDISSATLSRVSRCVRYGNGYRTVLSVKQDEE